MNEKDFLSLVKKYKKKNNPFDDEDENKTTSTTRSTTKTPSKEEGAFAELVDKYTTQNNRSQALYDRNRVGMGSLFSNVRSEEKKIDNSKSGYFQSSSVFDDGYDVGDVTKTILGTAGDAGLNVVKGAGFVVEGVADLGMYTASVIANKTQSGDLEAEAQMKAQDLLDKMMSERDFNAYAKRIGHKGTYQEYVADVKAQAQEILETAQNGGVAASIKAKAQKNTVDDLTKGAQGYLDDYSVLGDKGRGIAQGLGQVGAMVATGGIGGAIGVGGTAATTSVNLLSGWGNSMSQAYQEGASDTDAWTYGAIAGTADALTELIFGGLGKSINAVGLSKGLSSADDMLAKKLSSKLTNQIAKNFTEFGIKAGAEGFEEVLAGTAQAIGKKLTYKSEEEFMSILEDENLLDQFVAGMVTSGIVQSGVLPGTKNGSLREANKNKTDFITGQTQNEQAVIKRETEKRIAEAEKDGTKLTGRQKSSIEAQVESDLEKGYISTDTIEEVLGGDTYNSFKKNVEGFMGSDTYKEYNKAVEEEKSLRQEFEELQKVKLTEADLGQQSRFTEVKNRLEEIKKDAKTATLRKELDAEIERINGLKNTLRQEVSEKVKNERLSESYNEFTRSTEKFKADPAEYDNEFARKTVANIVKSGIANNTNETHEFVNFMAKISADKGVVFSLTDAERLAGTRYAKDGAVTNAYVTSEGDIVINNDSKKRLNSLVGHEVTHVLEGSQLYGELQKAVFDYAQKKGDYDSRLKAITDLYQKYDPKADPKKELTADLVGDYLFTDKDFINKLSTDNRNVFQKIYDEIKYLLKVVTAGSKEARALEKAKKAFDAVYRENVKGKPQGKYSLSEQKPPTFEDLTKKGPTKIVKITDGIESGSYADMKKAALDKAKNEGWFDVPHHNNDTDSFIFLTEKSFSHAYSNLKSDFGEDTIRSMAHIPEIIREAVLVNVADPKNPTKAEKKVYTFFAAVEGVAGVEPVKLTVKEFDFKSLDSAPQNVRSYFEKNGIEDSYNSLYDARALEVIGIEGIKKESDASGEVYGKTPEARATSNSEISIAELLKIVKGDSEKYIPKTSTGDSAGGIENQDNRSLSPEQEEYFKDSVVRDENGNLKPMYHGTSQGGHTMFDPYGKAKYGLFGTGTYFTDSKTIAESYTTKGKGNAPQVYETYLNITNPIDMDAQADPDAWRNALPEADFPESGTNEQFYRAMEDYFEDMEYARWEASEIAMGVIEDMGYDGITHIGGGRVNADGERHQVYIAFQPEQIKNIDNAKPTNDPDIRKSLSAKGDTSGNTGGYAVYGDNVRVKDKSELDFAPIKEPAPVQEDIAPVRETVQEDIGPVREDVPAVFPDDGLPGAETDIDSLTDADVPPEVDAPYYDDADEVTPADPFANRDIKEVGNRKVNAYMYENPEVKPFFQAEANMMLGELERTTKGERFYNMDVYYDTNGEAGITGTSRHTSQDIAYLLDELKYSYKQIEAGLKAIIEDNGKENNAVSKRIEFLLNDRLMNGYQDPDYGWDYPPNQDYINLLNEKQITEYNEEARNALFASGDEYAPIVDTPVAKTAPADDLGPVAYEAIRPRPDDIGPVAENVPGVEYGDKLVRVDSNNGRPGEKQRKWVGTSTNSEAVGRKVLPDDLNQDTIHYQPISNKETLGKANGKLDGMGYEKSVTYFHSKFADRKTSLEDIALGERLIQEAIKKGDTKTAGELIQEVAILGTELGQKVQALSIIKRLTPEGQLQMLQRVVERGKTKGDKAYDGVELTQDMIDKILAAYGKDGTYDQDKLNAAVEDVKQQIADQMKVTVMDKVNAWRYLSMLGNPKTHIRNLVSNVAMRGTVAVKNTLARTIETFAPIGNRTKTWKGASDDVKAFARNTAAEMKDILSDDSKYSEDASIKEKRQIFKNKVINGVYEFNSDMLSKEDWWFSKPAFVNSLSEFLTANGIRTKEDIQNNPDLIEKAKLYATEQSQIATFRQYSWLASKINDIERHNAFTNMAVGAVIPFKKTPINVAKAGLNYSPLGFAKTLTYDIAKVKSGKMEASTMIDHLAQNITGSALTLLGYALAQSGFISGGGEDDKEGKFDTQLGAQSYAVNIGGQSYSLSWLSPVAMPLFVGANAYEQLVEGKEWNGDVVVETLAQTLDPLNEMSFLSGLNQVLSSYDSGMQKFAGIGEAMVQNYATQFVPTLSSQVATVIDDKKRSTKVSGDTGFAAFEGIVNKLKYKIPGLRQTLEPSTDIWGNEVKQTENVMQRAYETFLAPYATKGDISTAVDEEIKTVYGDTGDTGVIPNVPYNYVNYKGEKHEMSAAEFTEYKKMYGQLSYDLLGDLFDNQSYINASESEKADMIGKVYDYARDEAKKRLLAVKGVNYTNTTSDGSEVYRENSIKGAIDNDMTPEEYSFYRDNPEKYDFLKGLNVSYTDYSNADEDTKEAYSWAFNNPEGYAVSKAVTNDVAEYKQYTKALNELKADKDDDGKTISGSRKEKVVNYLNGLDLDYGEKLVLFKSEYNADDTYNYEIIDYLNGRDDLSYSDVETILKKLGFKVSADGTISW